MKHIKTVFKNKGTNDMKITSDIFFSMLSKVRFLQTKLRWLNRKSTNYPSNLLKILNKPNLTLDINLQ